MTDTNPVVIPKPDNQTPTPPNQSPQTTLVLTDSDFDLGSDTKINVYRRDCMLVLFYSNNEESMNVLEIWKDAASQVAGPIFATCDLMVNKSVAKAFTSLNTSNGSLHWAALRTIPFIMVYQNGWPVAFYNGERSVQTFVDYALALACRSDYHEPINNYAGMQANNNLEMKGVKSYGGTFGAKDADNPYRQDSLQFGVKYPLRDYPSTDKPVLVGSQEAAQAEAQTQAENVATGTPEQSLLPGVQPTLPPTGVRVQPAPVAGGGEQTEGVPTEEAPSSSEVTAEPTEQT